MKEERGGSFQGNLSPKLFFYGIVFSKMIICAWEIDIAHCAKTFFTFRQRSATNYAAMGKEQG